MLSEKAVNQENLHHIKDHISQCIDCYVFVKSLELLPQILANINDTTINTELNTQPMLKNQGIFNKDTLKRFRWPALISIAIIALILIGVIRNQISSYKMAEMPLQIQSVNESNSRETEEEKRDERLLETDGLTDSEQGMIVTGKTESGRMNKPSPPEPMSEINLPAVKTKGQVNVPASGVSDADTRGDAAKADVAFAVPQNILHNTEDTSETSISDEIFSHELIDRTASLDSNEEVHSKKNQLYNEGIRRKTSISSLEKDKNGIAPPKKTPIPTDSSDHDLTIAQAFLQQVQTVDGLHFQPAEGYWANTYIPGDSNFRRLHTRLLTRNRHHLELLANQTLLLDDRSKQPIQPFDPPNREALAVYVNSNQSWIENRTRILFQIGLKGTERAHGIRSAMHVGIVLDIDQTMCAEDIAIIRSLLFAFEQAKDIGDQFCLTISKKPKDIFIPPDAFRYGPLFLSLQTMFERDNTSNQNLDICSAIQTATKQIQQIDDSSNPLGNSAVILITNRAYGTLTDAIVKIAHQHAMMGTPLSVMGIGSAVNRQELDRIALSGQGNRRILETIIQAKQSVENELSAFSRIIARAIRIQIRFGSGVELVDIVGSYRLKAPEANRVKEMEQRIDQRLAKALGIQSDRGEDQDGIQIVIPNFYANDAHVILLDVVVSNPGHIADVSVKYKDLVHLTNQVNRVQLNLSNQPTSNGHLELNVFKNFLAYTLSQKMDEAGRYLSQNQTQQALLSIQYARDLLKGITIAMNGLSKDDDILYDIQMLNEYEMLLKIQGLPTEDQNHVADSLILSSRLKKMPRPSYHN